MQHGSLAVHAGSRRRYALQYRSPIRGFLLGAILVPECRAVLLHIVKFERACRCINQDFRSGPLAHFLFVESDFADRQQTQEWSRY
jgi:hypothetical protein